MPNDVAISEGAINMSAVALSTNRTPLRHRLVTQAMALQLAIIAMVLFIVSVAVTSFEQSSLEEQYGLRAQAVAESVAEIPLVRELVVADEISPELQTTAEAVRLRTGVDFVVIVNMESIRYSHPRPERIGTPVSTDPGRAQAGISDWYVETGSLGQSVRGKVPIWDLSGEEVVGTVSVGVLTGEVSDTLEERLWGLLMVAAAAFAAGAVVAYWAARRIRRQTLGLEPPEIAALYEHRDAMLRTLQEGVLAVDSNGVVVLANEAAATMLRLGSSDTPTRLQDREDLAPLLALSSAQTPQVDVQFQISNQILLVTAAPLTIRDKQQGAVFTFRDRTELQGLASELESAHGLVDALRAQAHEHSNSLHTIAGLIELGHHTDVLSVIEDHSSSQRAIADLYRSDSSHDTLIVAVLLAKATVAGERGVLLRTHLGELPQLEIRVWRDVVTILGNLVDNAVDQLTVQRLSGGEVEVGVWCMGNVMRIDVSDNGGGIETHQLDDIFRAGYTTKDTRSHDGLGLALVSDLVERYDGSITVDSDHDSGTLFSISLNLDPMVRAEAERRLVGSHG